MARRETNSREEEKLVTVKVKEDLHETLEKLKEELKASTFDETIRKLIERERTSDVIVLPEKSDIPLHDLIIEAIEEVKPPSKWRDIFLFMLMGALGGAGLGIILPW